MTNTRSINLKPNTFTKKAAKRVYIIWAVFGWFLSFLILYPFFLVCIWFRPLRKIMPFLNQIWCLFFFPFSFLRVKVLRETVLSKNEPVVYVSNHGSYLDIPLLTYILPGFPAFLGKASLARIPMFGYMFRNFHIIVERGNAQGRAKALQLCRKNLNRGRSVIIFPEGSIHSKIQPGLADMKEGAFKLAIQCQVPVIPITICHNWYILPDDGHWLPNFYTCEAVIHKPIITIGLKESDSQKLSYKVRSIIEDTLEEKNQTLLQKLHSEN